LDIVWRAAEGAGMTHIPPEKNVLDDAWDQVVGGMEWLKSVLFGEFSDHRPLSAVVADMLVSFIPGVVIVTSARDAVAVILRLANHPEKRQELMEWILLSACLIVIALPLAMAAGGAAAAGVGAVIGGIAGSELGAVLRAVMLMLIKEAQKLVELVCFLQRFVKGDILKFLRAVDFVKYEKPLLQAMAQITGRLLEMVVSLRKYLESVRYFDSVKVTIAKLAAWEKKFHMVQQDALKQVPRALAELDARLAKVLAQTAPKEGHTIATGVQVDKTVAVLPAKQRVRDTAGKVLGRVDETAMGPARGPKKPASSPTKASTKQLDAPPKDAADPFKPPDGGTNTKTQAVVDSAAALDRERITQLSKEAYEAERIGDKALAEAKVEEARRILRPYLPKNPGENWDEVVKRLDVSSPKNGAVFWSGDPLAAQRYAGGINGVTLETTYGGRVIDGWDEVNKGYPWSSDYGAGPYGRDLWASVSKKYAEGVTGSVNAVQSSGKLWDTNTLWHNAEKPILQNMLLTGKVSEMNIFTINNSGEFIPLSENYIDALMRVDGTSPL
jgi:hypothetical protein